MNSTSTAAVTSSVTVAAVDSAPLVSLAWLLCSASMAALPALSICSLRRCAGPLISQRRVDSMLWVTCSVRPGSPSMNCSTTKARMPPRIAKPPNNTSATAPPRGRPCRSSQSTTGTSSALNSSATSTGTTITSSLASTQNSASAAARMTSKRHAQAAVLRTMGSTDASSTFADISPAYPQRRRVKPDRGRLRVARGRRRRHDPVTTPKRP
ncbi:hypothetical protein I549_0929 [Mycobacterium avium subsp. avium 2285 (R)]|nr:hypothetical protein I549_0929 [Mycobacterium avium subsp. avium 2285 (R)]